MTRSPQESDKAPRPRRELTPAQRKAIPHILASRNMEEAAERAEISVRTLWRWRSDDVFEAALSEAEGSAIDYAMRRLLLLQDRAIDTLETVITDEAAPKSIRVRASLGVLDAVLKLREMRDLEARLIALEQLYGDPSVNH